MEANKKEFVVLLLYMSQVLDEFVIDHSSLRRKEPVRLMSVM